MRRKKRTRIQTDMLGWVMQEMEARRGQWPQIAEDADVDYSWLTKVMQGNIYDPGTRRLQALANYLQGLP